MVKPGYKQTTMGVVPEDWEVCAWEDAGSCFSSGATPYRAISRYYEGDIKWVSSGELNYNNITETIEHISEEAQKNTNLTIHPANTFLMAITGLEAAGTRGSCAILGVPATTNQSCMAIYGTEKLDVKYLFYYYLSKGDDLAFKYCQGTKQQSYTASIVKKLPIILPPIAEQSKIANALSEVDQLIGCIEKLIIKKKAIKQGAMQDLLSVKKRLPGFSGEWSDYLLGDLGVFIKGSGISRAESNSGRIPAVRYGELYTAHQNYVTHFVSHISKEVAAKAKQVYKGDILFAASGETKTEIGKCAAIIDDQTVYAGGDILIFRPHEPHNPVFMGTLLNTAEVCRQRAEKGQGDAVVHIHADSLGNINIKIPEIKEQDAIAEILLGMDKEIEMLEMKLEKYRQLKQGTMQQLLTGKIRLE